MSKRARTVIFIVCVFLFVLATPTVILYSQGYRLNFETKKITQTGAFYFKAAPGRAEIYLNGEFKNRTALITNDVLIGDLLPKTYKIEVKKNGCHSWQKNLEVKEKEVTEVQYIILFTQNPDFAIIEGGEPKISASPTSSDKTKAIDSNNYEIWILFLEDQPGPPRRKAGEKIFLTRFSEKIGDIFWLNDYYLIFGVGNKIKIAEIDNRDKLNIIDLTEFENPEIFWDGDNKKLYVSSKGKLYLLENLLP